MDIGIGVWWLEVPGADCLLITYKGSKDYIKLVLTNIGALVVCFVQTRCCWQEGHLAVCAGSPSQLK